MRRFPVVKQEHYGYQETHDRISACLANVAGRVHNGFVLFKIPRENDCFFFVHVAP